MEKQLPVRFIMCSEEQIQKMKSKNSLNLAENQKETEIKINLNLDKEPEENPVENFIKELEKVST